MTVQRIGRTAASMGAATCGALLAFGASDGFALEFERRVIDGQFSSGGEVVVDERRGLVLTADRDAEGIDAIRPGVSIVDARWQRHRRTLAFWTQPFTSVPAAGGASTTLVPQVPSGIDSDARRGLLVTSNSATDTVTIAHVAAPLATAADLVRVGDHPFGVAIDERAGLAYVAMYGSDRIDVLDVRRKRLVRSIGGLASPTKLALDERTGTLYAGNAVRPGSGGEDAIAVIDTATGTVRARIAVDPNARPTVDPEAGLVYAASFATGRIAVIDARTDQVLRWIETGSTPHGVAVDPGRELLYAPNLLRNTVTVIDRRTLDVIATEPVADVPLGIAVDERTGWAYVSSRDASTLTLLRPRR